MPEAHSLPLLHTVAGMIVGFVGVHHDRSTGFGRIHAQKARVNPRLLRSRLNFGCRRAARLLREHRKDANRAQTERQTSIEFHTNLSPKSVYLASIHAFRHASFECTRRANGERRATALIAVT
jgi:hypothetical protein